MVNRPTNDQNGEFDDEFVEDDFGDTDFDESQYDDPDSLPADEDYQDEDFDSGEWQEEDKKQASRNGFAKERSGLSFNTIAIIGALVVGGGMMIYKITSETAKQSAGQEGFFQSLLNIGGVMDGELFGEKEPEPTAEEIVAQEEKSREEGFLNNPEAVENAGDNPPQPSPIAPAETVNGEDLLTPMPEQSAGGETPRGPDEAVEANQAGAGASPTSAEELLRQAMANRAQKQEQENTQSQQQAAQQQDTAQEAQPAIPPNVAASAIDRVNGSPAETTAVASAGQAAKVSEALIEAANPPPVQTAQNAQGGGNAQQATMPVPLNAPAIDAIEANTEAAVANRRSLDEIQGKMEQVLDRVAKLENRPISENTSENPDVQKLQQEIAALKAQIGDLRQNPAPAPKTTTPAPVKEQTAMESEPAKPKTTVKPSKSSATRKVASWELRAAQPGRAWVSKTGERDMKSLMVGDTLEGIGTINAISYQNGQWIVYGSQGQIRQ